MIESHGSLLKKLRTKCLVTEIGTYLIPSFTVLSVD